MLAIGYKYDPNSFKAFHFFFFNGIYMRIKNHSGRELGCIVGYSIPWPIRNWRNHPYKKKKKKKKKLFKEVNIFIKNLWCCELQKASKTELILVITWNTFRSTFRPKITKSKIHHGNLPEKISTLYSVINGSISALSSDTNGLSA